MNYEPNTKLWKVGDYVIHDADAKNKDMLMVVIGIGGGGILRTRYINPNHLQGMDRVFANEEKFLHDPVRFHIEIPAQPKPKGGIK